MTILFIAPKMIDLLICEGEYDFQCTYLLIFCELKLVVPTRGKESKLSDTLMILSQLEVLKIIIYMIKVKL